MLFKKSLFFLLLFPFGIYAQYVDTSSSFYKAYYFDNGSIASEGFLENGKPNAYWITYYPNQLRKSEGNRINFELDGLWKFYNKKGNLENSITYKKGIKNGKYKYFSDQCFLIKEENYTNDTLDGDVIEYFNDSINNRPYKSYKNFDKGLLDGIAYDYSKEGILVTVYYYQKGFLVSTEKINRKNNLGNKEGIWKEFYDNKRLKKEERYKNGLLNGYVKMYSRTGKLEEAILYINGEKQDQNENLADFDLQYTYYENGKIKSSATYNLAGKKEGVTNYFDEEGELKFSEIYKNGVLIERGKIDEKGLNQGLWESFYLNGNVKNKGEYVNGKKLGKWEYFFHSGKKEQEGYFDKNGKYTGEWVWYYESGNILRRENYRRGIEDGMLEEYDRGGKLITKGEYIDGEKEGEWYYKLNDHKEEGKYRYGERNGLWIFHHSTGKKSFEGNYNEGGPEGKHKYYDDKGVLIREESYSYGIKDGKWKWYDSFGIETMSITYKDGKEKKINGEKVKFYKK